MNSLSRDRVTQSSNRNFGFARTRDLAFSAVRKLWKLRQEQGVTQQDIAARLNKDPAWVSRKLSGPTNWTLHTFGDLVDAMDGEVEISISDLLDGPLIGNYDAYAGYGESVIERRRPSLAMIEHFSEGFTTQPTKVLETSTNSKRVEASPL